MADLHDRFAAFFPIASEVAELHVVAGGDPGGDSEQAWITVRLIVWDVDGEQRTIRDIKEQQLRGGPVWLYEDEARVTEMLHAQQEVLGEVLADPRTPIDGLMPCDLLWLDVMKLKTARGREQFAKALRAKSRLGR
ncbi:hypothetical protein [Paraliomyxa miuraensis]|uniref:hypothetical protein n=1 Tax=Paraliomyxa miuraensis TaxID=376150 RepID=UPI002259627B|nr:hypothetical protein [Paraliomyxa miuraensis]MCX4239333.1 hypothetical protein [Paraliomyxa miuraensis]